MLETLFVSCFVFISLLAIIYAFGFCLNECFFCQKDYRTIIVFCFSGNVSDVEYRIRSAMVHNRWRLFNRSNMILIIDDGMDSETLKICSIIAAQEECIYIADGNSVNDIVDCIVRM